MSADDPSARGEANAGAPPPPRKPRVFKLDDPSLAEAVAEPSSQPR